MINVEVTGPWSHAGAYTSLEAPVRHYLNPSEALASYDTNQLSQTGIQNVSLSDTQVGELVEILVAVWHHG